MLASDVAQGSFHLCFAGFGDGEKVGSVRHYVEREGLLLELGLAICLLLDSKRILLWKPGRPSIKGSLQAFASPIFPGFEGDT